MRLTIGLALATAVITVVAAPPQSTWVYRGDDQRLHYGTDARGNRIMDFSHAGFRGGGVALPAIPAARTVEPASGDSTARIQAAIDDVSRMPRQADGFRGAVMLARGTFQVDGQLKIAASGVVLSGAGSGENGTVIRVGGAPHRFIDISGSGSWAWQGEPIAMTDLFVPAGAGSVRVKSSAAFRVGDRVLVQRPVTNAWIHFMGMDTLVRDGKPQTWIKAGTSITTDRVIMSIAGDRIALDVPLSDTFDAAYLDPPGGSVVKYAFEGRLEQVE